MANDGIVRTVEEDQRRIRVKWKRGFCFRADWHYLLFLIEYTDSVDAEGVA